MKPHDAGRVAASRSMRPIDPDRIIQEQFAHDPWKMLIACMMLNQTGRKQVDPVLMELFPKYGMPVELANARAEEVVEIIRPCGFQNRRARTLIDFSREWNDMEQFQYASEHDTSPFEWPGAEWVADMPGVGKYALDSYRFFILGDMSRFESGDKELRAWLEERGNQLVPGVVQAESPSGTYREYPPCHICGKWRVPEGETCFECKGRMDA